MARALHYLPVANLLASRFGCAPEVGEDPHPDILELDPTPDPPLAPQPSGVVIDPATGPIPLTCGAASPAEIVFPSSRGVGPPGRLDAVPDAPKAQAPIKKGKKQ